MESLNIWFRTATHLAFNLDNNYFGNYNTLKSYKSKSNSYDLLIISN